MHEQSLTIKSDWNLQYYAIYKRHIFSPKKIQITPMKIYLLCTRDIIIRFFMLHIWKFEEITILLLITCLLNLIMQINTVIFWSLFLEQQTRGIKYYFDIKICRERKYFESHYLMQECGIRENSVPSGHILCHIVILQT